MRMARAGCPRSRPAREEYTFSPARKPSGEMLNVPVRTKSHGISGEGSRVPLDSATSSCARNAVSQGDAKRARHSLPTASQVQAILPQNRLLFLHLLE